jgi:quinol-cytochrome oxidoreductase complex cytochrome b subunit
MVSAVQEQAASQAVRGRARRQRDEELLVWPDLVFVEFISAVLFTITITMLSIAINAPLLDRANASVTPNPSKAPWYFLNLQELLLHMHPALAGVIVPTVALIALAAIPYFDRSNEGQGVWFGTARAIPLTILGAVVGVVGSLLLILWDGSKHVVLWAKLTGNDVSEWPSQLNWLRSSRSLQTDIAWPEEIRSIPLGEKVLRTDLLGLPAIDLNVDLPAVLVEQVIPVTLMVGLPILLSIVAWSVGLARTRRDHMVLQFSGFIAVYIILTIVGTAFRGQGMEFLPFWEVTTPVS